MNLYARKKRWKLILVSAAVLIVSLSIWYTSRLVQRIARNERNNIEIWANAIQRKASLVNYQEHFFEQLRDEERKRVELHAQAIRRAVKADASEDIGFYAMIISGNTTIPVIQTDVRNRILGAANVDFDPDTVEFLSGSLRQEFSVYDPIVVSEFGNTHLLYYKDSRNFTELRNVLQDITRNFFEEVVTNAASVPVIITDSTFSNPIAWGNIDSTRINDSLFVHQTIEEMQGQNDPIVIDLAGQGKRYIFYKDSYALLQLRYYPFVQFGVIGLFILLAYVVFSTARRSEQNQVWVGMSKETAHQLGTPLSSMMAWIELLRMKKMEPDIVDEMAKDVQRLDTITQRFSKIGSAPELKPENIVQLVYHSVDYLKNRTSRKVQYHINQPIDTHIAIPLNTPLFEWVIENLCKNAIDAMSGEGRIDIRIEQDEKQVILDISDTGKGIPRNRYKTVFHPGYTSKKRGWGLGLSLVDRIISNYHKGKIFVKHSALDQGTTFRIVLNKA